MKILDLFAGTGGEKRRSYIESFGVEYITMDWQSKFNCNITADIFDFCPGDLAEYDFVWASVPCTVYSLAGVQYGNYKDYLPVTEKAVYSDRLVNHVLALLKNKKSWLIENPLGLLRKMSFMRGFPRVTVTYCKYGFPYMKPTDLWGFVPGWVPRPVCHRGSLCHISSPLGSKNGLQSLRSVELRSEVPDMLWGDIVKSLIGRKVDYFCQPKFFSYLGNEVIL